MYLYSLCYYVFSYTFIIYIMLWISPWENKSSINSENIFDEFTDSKEIKEELEKTDKENEKDIYYYLKKLSWVFLILNIIFFLIIIACFGYIYIQNKEQKTEYNFLSPVCQLFLGSKSIYPSTCYWVTPTLAEFTSKLDELSKNQSQAILPLLWDTYALENFNVSKKVGFILEKWESRLRPLEILSEFDAMKDLFSSTDKSEITCYDIELANDILSMTCDSYSSDWNTDILSVENTALRTLNGWGTSISKASSFINFYEQYSESPFTVVEKPDFYTSESFQSWPYTRRTTFQFSLRYAKKTGLDIN